MRSPLGSGTGGQGPLKGASAATAVGASQSRAMPTHSRSVVSVNRAFGLGLPLTRTVVPSAGPRQTRLVSAAYDQHRAVAAVRFAVSSEFSNRRGAPLLTTKDGHRYLGQYFVSRSASDGV